MSRNGTASVVETGSPPQMASAAGFVLRALLWVAALIGLLRLPWVQKNLMLPFAGFQQAVGCAMVGAPRNAVYVDFSCTGSDAMALAVGAILAFPVPWKRRLAGAALGLLVISVFNTIRIGSLAAVVDNRDLFRFLHLTAWPAVLIVIAAGYVFLWMQLAQREAGASWRAELSRLTRRNGRLLRFVGLTVLLVVLYYWASGHFLRSDWMLRIAHWATAFGGWVMQIFGVESQINGNFISTPYGRWVVTQECVATPLVAVYLAAVLTAALTPLKKTLAVLAAFPLFVLLGSARLLVLALPRAAVGSHETAIHAFYQMLAAVVVVAVLARRRGGARRATAAIGAGALAGLLAGWVSSLWLPALIESTRGETVLSLFNPQGALSILPGYQIGLWFALVWVLAGRDRVRPLLLGAAVLSTFQVVLIVTLGWVAAEAGVTLPVIAIRMVTLLAPLALAWPLIRADVDAEAEWEDAIYRHFWADVGDNFPDLSGTESTAMYREDEQRLFNDYLQPLEGKRIFKTDLWDEAKNTRILRWAAGEGGEAYGIDISTPILDLAKREFESKERVVRGTVSDVRTIPFADGSFDAVYSMGTVEHFDETQKALGEIFRVLRPGGTGVIGVPNRRDPFLRPLVVALMYRLGLYGYGFEKSYSRPTFRRMLEEAGFEVLEESAILFIPGYLRMAELALHSWARPLTVLTVPLVKLFRFLSRRFPGLRRHGYLLATAVRRPE